MPSTWSYAAHEVPAPYYPGGTEWMAWRLAQVGRNFTKSWYDGTNDLYYLECGEANVSRNQLLFDAQPADGQLALNATTINVAPMGTHGVTVTGPPNKLVKVRFDGVGFVEEVQFNLDGGGNYNYVLGPCPASQRVVTPQMFEFYVEDGACSPVALMVTFT